MTTRKEVEAWCERNDVTLTVEQWSSGAHVHADIDADHKIFRAHGIHNIGLHDGDARVNWAKIYNDLMAADLGDCTDPECEYCNEV